MATREARTADKAQNEKNQLALKELVKKAENRKCADCKTKDSRWASLNLGVFLCLNCSGIHRAMGTHISKVRSIDLDAWTVDQVNKVAEIGNAKANQFWEALLPPSFIPNESEIEKFIRNKYESKLYVHTSKQVSQSARKNTVMPQAKKASFDIFEEQILEAKPIEAKQVKVEPSFFYSLQNPPIPATNSSVKAAAKITNSTTNEASSKVPNPFSNSQNTSVPVAAAMTEFADFSQFSISKPPKK